MVELGVAHRGGLSISFARCLASVGVLKDVQALGVCGHQAILDAVVNHLDEVACAARPAVQPTGLLRRDVPGATWRALGRIETWGDGVPQRGESIHSSIIAADHEAVATFESPHSAGGADIEEVNSLLSCLGRVADVLAVVRVAAVDEGVARTE